MLLRWKWFVAVLVVVCLGSGVLTAVAMNCHSDSGGHDHSEHQTADKITEPPADETPESLLKKADELLKEAGQAKDKDAKVSVQVSLIEHCSKMSLAATGLLNECADLLKEENPDTARLTEKTKQAMSLLKKCVVLTDKCHNLIDKTASPKELWVCPMHSDVTSEKAGKCPKCGMNLEKKK